MPVSHGGTAALFVSYAHNDNEPLVSGQTGWVENFQHALKVRLKQLLGREPDLWWDLAKLRGNEVIGSAIDQGLTRSAILVAIISPSYVDFERSDWCRKELESFCAAAGRAGVTPDVRNHIFKVVKTFVSLDHQPDLLKDLRGYDFFRKDPSTGRLREFFLQDSAPVDPEYIKKIDDLAEDIHLFVESLKDQSAPAPAPGEPTTSQVLYLAETTSDLTATRDQIARILRQANCCVLPDRELPHGHGGRLRDYVRECLDRSRVSVHLIGANYGAIPEGEMTSVTVIQNELAAERSGNPSFSRLIWMPTDVRAADERQRLFIEHLRTDSDAQRGAEILRGGLAELGTLIQSRLQPRVGRPAEIKKQPEGDGLKDVYLICDQRDREAGEALRDLIYAGYPGLEVWLPPLDGDEADVRAIHREYLTLCDGVLLYFGNATESWLRAKLCELKKVSGYGRERPLSARGIYVAPPASPAKDRFRTREAMVLQGVGAPSIQALAPFLAQLGLEPTA
jgi:TIR domain